MYSWERTKQAPCLYSTFQLHVHIRIINLVNGVDELLEVVDKVVKRADLMLCSSG